jgi:hypothetical protein
MNSRCLAAIAVSLAYAVYAVAAGWTDRGEYDLVLSIRAEASPQKRLTLLDDWKAKYPATELRQARNELYFAAYQSLGDSPRMLGTAQAMLADQPNNLVGLYWCTLLVAQANQPSAALLNTGEKAAGQLLAGLNTAFSAEKKPQAVTAEEWQKQRNAVELLAHRTLGWIKWQRGDYAGAEPELTQGLRLAPNDAEIAAWLGIVMALEKQPEKQPAALWHMARAASLRDAGALPPAQRRQMDAALERLYVSYHGETGGLDQLRSKAAESPFPPADFQIESAASVAARRREEEINRANPELAAWLRIQKRLDADGAETFWSDLQKVPLPKLKGVLLHFSPPGKPQELALSMNGNASQDLILKLSSPLPNEAEPGITLEIEGAAAESYMRDPFRLTVTADPDKVGGWPEPPQPPARRRQ